MGYGRTNAGSPAGGGGQTDFYQCASVNTSNQTWTGYKATLTDGVYTLAETATTGLSYTSVMPKVGWICDAEALVRGYGLHGIVPTDHVFYNALTSATGWEVSASGASVENDTCLGQNVFATTASGGYFRQATTQGIPMGSAARTLSFWARKMGTVTNGWSGVGYGNDHSQGVRFTWGIRNDYPTFSVWADDSWNYDGIDNFQSVIPDNNWHHWALTSTTGKFVSIYMDGQRVLGILMKNLDTQAGYIAVGDYAEESFAPNARYSSLRIFDRILTDPEIYALAAEFSPTTVS